MKEKAKVIIRCVIFFLIVFAILVVLSDLFEGKNNHNYDKRFYTYRNFPKGTVDGVFIGTSAADRFWSPARAYVRNGHIIYPLSSDAMPGWLYTYAIDEVLAHQNLELILIDVRGFIQSNYKASVMDARARRFLNSLDFFSINRIKASFHTAKIISSINDPDYDEWGLSYLFPFVKYHSIWSEDDYSFDNHIGSKTHNYGGFYINKTLTFQAEPQTPVEYPTGLLRDLDPIAEAALYDLIDYINKKDLNVLFVVTPKFFPELEMGRINTILSILDRNGMDYVTFELSDAGHELAVDLNPKTDFYDEGHVNYKGAKKFTDVFTAYLKKYYDLPDHRNDPVAQEIWDGVNNRLNSWLKQNSK